MSKRTMLHVGLLIAITLFAALLSRGASLYVIPLFLIAYAGLSFINRNGNDDPSFKDDDSADWWKNGKGKKNWDI